MGLFDNLKKAANAVAKEAEKGFNSFQKDVQTAFDQRLQPQQPQQQQYAPQQPQQQYAPQPAPYCAKSIYPATTDQTQRIYEIITRRFPQFEVRCNVTVNSLLPAAHPKCIPITYLLCQNSTPKMAVILMHQKQHGGMNLKGTDAACVQLGIPTMHLYHEYENAEDYIIGKINSLM